MKYLSHTQYVLISDVYHKSMNSFNVSKELVEVNAFVN